MLINGVGSYGGLDIGAAVNNMQKSSEAMLSAVASGDIEQIAKQSTAMAQSKVQAEAAVAIQKQATEFEAGMVSRLLDIRV